ncbi:hypothetical protein B0A49_08663 [Cryomyces minteri]|uniref:Uncharacterized protein n=1 Tax=Cryomyces minteri TaxID=331657 RepID=A0A4U0WH33_9PEZI|nr:hypothetical protein B0A49_08663 [Cryomyces minteri]
MANAPAHVQPGRALGFMSTVPTYLTLPYPIRSSLCPALGASLHDTLTRIKAEGRLYPKIDTVFHPARPIDSPVIINLPCNGIRLRFDGPDQRLRLIEVVDFRKTRLSHKNNEIVRAQETEADTFTHSAGATGPSFRHVYKLFGPTYPGEFIPSAERPTMGTYAYSYPGIAFNFLLPASSWSPNVDMVSLLSSAMTSAATSMAIFDGSSWANARADLFTRRPLNPRSLALAFKGKESEPDEIEVARIHGEGRIELDLVTELGPPDSIYRKNDRRLSIHQARNLSGGTHRNSGISAHSQDGSTDTDPSSHDTSDDADDYGEEEDEEEEITAATLNAKEIASAECFYNYFHHGFDILISQATHPSPPSPKTTRLTRSDPLTSLPTIHLTATKVILHGNVPSSYSFNRHRRSRWTLDHVPSSAQTSPLTSEMGFRDISARLKDVFKSTYASPEEEANVQRGMVVNRGWGDSPGSSCELLGGWEEGVIVNGKAKPGANGDTGSGSEAGVGNTELFGFPGMVFEVLKIGTVCALTVY